MWQADVVAFLRDCKDHGWEFDPAWQSALRKYPPRGTGFGNGRRQQALFGDDDHEVDLVQFLMFACRDAWYGEKPRLAFLSVDLLTPPEANSFHLHDSSPAKAYA